METDSSQTRTKTIIKIVAAICGIILLATLGLLQYTASTPSAVTPALASKSVHQATAPATSADLSSLTKHVSTHLRPGSFVSRKVIFSLVIAAVVIAVVVITVAVLASNSKGNQPAALTVPEEDQQTLVPATSVEWYSPSWWKIVVLCIVGVLLVGLCFGWFKLAKRLSERRHGVSTGVPTAKVETKQGEGMTGNLKLSDDRVDNSLILDSLKYFKDTLGKLEMEIDSEDCMELKQLNASLLLIDTGNDTSIKIPDDKNVGLSDVARNATTAEFCELKEIFYPDPNSRDYFENIEPFQQVLQIVKQKTMTFFHFIFRRCVDFRSNRIFASGQNIKRVTVSNAGKRFTHSISLTDPLRTLFSLDIDGTWMPVPQIPSNDINGYFVPLQIFDIVPVNNIRTWSQLISILEGALKFSNFMRVCISEIKGKNANPGGLVG